MLIAAQVGSLNQILNGLTFDQPGPVGILHQAFQAPANVIDGKSIPALDHEREAESATRKQPKPSIYRLRLRPNRCEAMFTVDLAIRNRTLRGIFFHVTCGPLRWLFHVGPHKSPTIARPTVCPHLDSLVRLYINKSPVRRGSPRLSFSERRQGKMTESARQSRDSKQPMSRKEEAYVNRILGSLMHSGVVLNFSRLESEIDKARSTFAAIQATKHWVGYCGPICTPNTQLYRTGRRI